MTRPNPFAAAADRYAEGRPYHHARTLRRALAGRTPHLAVDVACGTGLSTRGLAELGIAAVGIDVAPAMVARARADTGLPCVVASAEALPVATGAVDLVTVGSGVHWLDQQRFAAEAARVLRQGGAAPFFDGGRGRVVRFRGSCRLLRRGAGERGREAAPGAGAGACAG